MSTQAEIIARRKAINELYQFSLIIGLTTTVLNYAPDGWNEEEAQIELNRDKTYRGLFRTMSARELTFYKDGFDLIKAAYNSGGVDEEILLQVDRFDYTTGGYTLLATLKADLATYVETDIGIKVQMVDSGFQEVVKNRESVNVNLMSDVTIDGVAITNHVGDLNIPDTNVNNQAIWGGDYGHVPASAYYVVPFLITATGGIDDAITPDITKTGFDAAINTGETIGRYFSAINGTLGGTIHAPELPQGAEVGLSIKMSVYNSDGTLDSEKEVVSGFGTDLWTFNLTFSEILTLYAGQRITFWGTWYTRGTGTYGLSFTSLSLTIDETYIGTTAKGIVAFEIYEAFLRTIQMISGVEDCLVSNKFGRTDTPIRTYPTDGEILHIFKGKYLRMDGQTVPVTLKDLFTSISAIYNIGLGIEDGTARIEDLSYFYADTLLLDLTGRVPVEILERSVDPGSINVSVQAGFSKYNNQLKPTGGYEFNTKTDYASQIKSVKTSKSIVSPYRADGTQMIAIEQQTDPATNVDGDDDIFLIKTGRITGGFQAETSENFIFVDGSPYSQKAFNLEFTPARNMQRWANVLASGTNGKYIWQNTDVNINLQTQKTGEVAPLVESADLNFSGSQRFIAEFFKFEVDLTWNEVMSILAAPYGYIVISTEYSGWIESMQLKNSKVTIKLKRRWQ